MLRYLIVTLAVATAITGCDRAPGGSGREELTVEWLGSDTGGLNARPTATWCDRDTSLRLFATKGEDGIALLLLPTQRLIPGSYPVFNPQDTLRSRPGVAIGSRWVDNKTVAAYQSDSGGLTLTKEATGLAGTFTVRMHGVNTSDTVRLTGHFGGITPAACPGAPPPPKAPPQ